MTPDPRTAELLNEIAQILAEDEEYPLDNTLLIAHVDTNWAEVAIFKDRGNHIVYRNPDLDALADVLLDLWERQPKADVTPRWREMQYLIRNGRFDATFIYPEEIDPDEDPLDRRDRIVEHYFGKKPILYPPLPGFDEPTYEF